MHRTQISLEEPLYEALRRQAFDRRISMSQMIREALAEYLGVSEPLVPDGGPPAAADDRPPDAAPK